MIIFGNRGEGIVKSCKICTYKQSGLYIATVAHKFGNMTIIKMSILYIYLKVSIKGTHHRIRLLIFFIPELLRFSMDWCAPNQIYKKFSPCNCARFIWRPFTCISQHRLLHSHRLVALEQLAWLLGNETASRWQTSFFCDWLI